MDNRKVVRYIMILLYFNPYMSKNFKKTKFKCRIRNLKLLILIIQHNNMEAAKVLQYFDYKILYM
jgi:hypothetical protein